LDNWFLSTGRQVKKSKILDEFVQHTGYNRKYALHILTHWGKETFLTVDGKLVKLNTGTDKRGDQFTGLW
jgi:hypothetical protein